MTDPITETAAPLASLFLSSMPNSSYLMPNGKQCIFVKGEYITTNEAEIAQLNLEVANNHPFISVDDGRRQVAAAGAEATMAAIRAAIEKQVRAEMAASVQAGNDGGNSEQAAVLGGITTSATLGTEDVQVSNSGASKLAALKTAGQ